MPALLSTFGVDWHLLIAQTVNFVILALALTWFLYKPVLRIVRERERVITKGVEDARRASEKLAHADTEASLRVIEADKKAEEILHRARTHAESMRSEMLKEAESSAVSIIADAHSRAKESAAKELRENDRHIARLAVLAAEKVLRQGT